MMSGEAPNEPAPHQPTLIQGVPPFESAERDEVLVADLRVRLKPASGPAPTAQQVHVALALARGDAAAAKSLPRGGARTRVLKLRDRMVEPNFFVGRLDYR